MNLLAHRFNGLDIFYKDGNKIASLIHRFLAEHVAS